MTTPEKCDKLEFDQIIQSTSDNYDEYNTIFTKKLLAETASSPLCHSKKRPDNSLDYKGGLLSDASLDSFGLASISSRPADSSSGFMNTFNVLENQIKSKRFSVEEVRKFLEYKNEYSNTISSPFSKSSNYSINEEPPSLLELELEASSRLQRKGQLFPPNLSPSSSSSTSKIQSPTCEMLYGLNLESLKSSDNETLGDVKESDQETHSGEYPEYLYHIARGVDGKMYLKVVRSLLIDKVLCGNRVSQMTRAYDDIEAVTRLLEEKEKDLELTVQIGKELLAQNTQLENRVGDLESELKLTNETLAQLSHELHQKNELIGILTNDADDSSENVTPTASKSINMDLLHRKVKSLEEENKSLKVEAQKIVEETDEVEEHERRLIADYAQHLSSVNTEFDGLNLELERLKEENRLQHEQIITVTTRLTEAEIRLHQITAENEEASSLLSITKENQNLLAGELCEFKTRYQEVLSLLQDAQEQLRRQRKRTQPVARSALIPGITAPAIDSLQSELMETSLFSELSLDSGISSDMGRHMNNSQTAGYKKIFETVRSARPPVDNNFSQIGSMSMSCSASQPRMSAYVFPGNTNSQAYKSTSSTYSTIYNSSLGGRSYSRESLASDSDEGYPSHSASGMPGAPGAKDLEAALKRLTPGEVLARRSMLEHAPIGTYSYEEGPNMPAGFRTPDSIMSTGSSGMSGMSSSQWRLPEKLQIIKPIEGSQTLHNWSRLAQPTLSGILEDRPGVKIRGGRELEDIGLQTYSLSDVEEDAEEQPGKRFQTYGCTYTITNSTVLHPDDGTSAVTFSLPPSQMSSQVASVCNSRQPTAPSTPRCLSRRNSCSTFSVNMGLASMLNERGIKAVTPSELNTPTGANFSPTVTPCNSPDGSPHRPPSPEAHLLSSLLSSGADILRKRFTSLPEMDRSIPTVTTTRPSRNKVALSRLERKALRSIKIMEKVENMGLNTILTTTTQPNISPLALHSASALYTTGVRNRTSSPMTQLTSLKQFSDNRKRNDDLVIDKETIKAVLSKGLSSDNIKDMSSGVSSISSDDSSSNYPDSELSDTDSRPSTSARRNLRDEERHNSSKLSPPSNSRLKNMQRQKSRRGMMGHGAVGGQRPDLGTVNGSRPHLRSDLRTSDKPDNPKKEEEKSLAQGVYGTISSLLFGRKGGLL